MPLLNVSTEWGAVGPLRQSQYLLDRFFPLNSGNLVEISLKFCLSMMYLIEVNNKIALLVLIVDFSLLPGGQLSTGRWLNTNAIDLAMRLRHFGRWRNDAHRLCDAVQTDRESNKLVISLSLSLSLSLSTRIYSALCIYDNRLNSIMYGVALTTARLQSCMELTGTG